MLLDDFLFSRDSLQPPSQSPTKRMSTTLMTAIFASLLAILVCSSFSPTAIAAPSPGTISPVVSTAWLAEHLEEPDLITLHIGPPGSYDQGHIPGARNASLRRLIRVNEAGIRDEMLPAGEIAKALAELGIGENSRIVIYFAEEGAAWAVSRYLLTLEYIGMSGHVTYLDGGLPKWLAEEHPISTNVSSFATTFLTVKPVPDVLVDTEWVLARLEDPKIVLLDGRPTEGYSGLAGHWDRLGHIPGAKNIPFSSLLAEKPPYLLKSREDLLDLFGKAGVMPGDTVVVYCGTGLWASLPYLVARYLDYEVRLYDGSFQEWSANKALPVAKPEISNESDG
jgi:thiosulfate/3-mercaptopyruvate sulfurtransferase